MSPVDTHDLDEAAGARFADQAELHGHPLEAENRGIPRPAAIRLHIGPALLRTGQQVDGVDDPPVPGRVDAARMVNTLTSTPETRDGGARPTCEVVGAHIEVIADHRG